MVDVTFDPGKHAFTLASRGLDFADAALVFDGRTLEFPDDRFDYGETRIESDIGTLRGRMVIIVWTPRGTCRHVISMRKANDREKARYRERLDQERSGQG